MKRSLGVALAGLILLSAAGTVLLSPGWTVAQAGPRGGAMYAGAPVDRVGAIYLPSGVHPGQQLRVAYLLAGGSGAAGLARQLGIAAAADQLAWQRTTPPFAVVVTSAGSAQALTEAIRFAERTLPLGRSSARRALIGMGPEARAAVQAALRGNPSFGTTIAIGGQIPRGLLREAQLAVRARRLRIFRIALPAGSDALPKRRQQLLDALALAFAPAAAGRASRAAKAVAPPGWVRIVAGPYGGTIWQGVIPDRLSPGFSRSALVYLPPHVDPHRRYPALYLLHGIRGSPYSFVGGLQFGVIADSLIHGGRVRPFIAVMPPAGASAQYRGEWTGTWERYVVQEVVPWADRHLPLVAAGRARTVAGFSAGAYGSVDIGLRHPGVFGTLESWSGYFTAPSDGSLTHATAAERLAHDPQALLPAAAPALRAGHIRFFLSAGRSEPAILSATQAFGRELSKYNVAHVLHLTAGSHHGRTWRSVLPAGLAYAFGR